MSIILPYLMNEDGSISINKLEGSFTFSWLTVDFKCKSLSTKVYVFNAFYQLNL